jgi:hypothetical protein
MLGRAGDPTHFTSDADGVPPGEHIGEASIEGKLRKLAGRGARGAGSREDRHRNWAQRLVLDA